MPENILLIVGSPRDGGNTDKLAEAFAHGARESGNRVTKYPVGGMDIRGCKDCKYCFKNDGKCALQDDMQLIYPALDNADMLVIASPIYFYSFSAQAKAFIDRMYAYAVKGFPFKSMALLLACADSDEKALQPAIDSYKAILDYQKMQDRGIVFATNVNDKGEVLRTEAIEQARALGRSIK